jgi:hypothetical protein
MKAKHSTVGYMIKLLNPNEGTLSGVSDPTGCDHIAKPDAWSCRLIIITKQNLIDLKCTELKTYSRLFRLNWANVSRIFMQINLTRNYTVNHYAGNIFRVVVFNSNSDFEISVSNPTKFYLRTSYLISCHRKRSNNLYNISSLKKTKLRGLSPQANYTDRSTAACRRS